MFATKMARRGFSMIELIIILAVILFLLALLLPAIQKVREAASRTQSINNLRQISIAMHSAVDDLRRLPPAYDKYGGLKFSAPIHVHLLPYIEQAPLYQQFGQKNKEASTAAIPTFVSPQDTSFMKNEGIQNYAANLRVFSIKAWKTAYDKNFEDLAGDQPSPGGLIAAMPDGTSNTITFATKYAVSGEGGSRYAAEPSSKFAAFFGQNAAKDKADPAKATATFQLMPGPKECLYTPLMAQSFSKSGLTVAMGDASTRLVNPNLSAQTWNLAVCPNDGMALGRDWDN